MKRGAMVSAFVFLVSRAVSAQNFADIVYIYDEIGISVAELLLRKPHLARTSDYCWAEYYSGSLPEYNTAVNASGRYFVHPVYGLYKLAVTVTTDSPDFCRNFYNSSKELFSGLYGEGVKAPPVFNEMIFWDNGERRIVLFIATTVIPMAAPTVVITITSMKSEHQRILALE
ncbi:MAG: hypothetical protein LBI91_04855 [Spirochaetaceae bacterium]|jgi:hypothetical protein|nr:hypothetical protein [Spirochaetaceae bacterium]